MSALLEFITYYAHVLLGFAGYAAGIVALSVRKGSSAHVKSGHIFAWLMLVPVVITTLVFMIEEPIPLAVLMAIATVYLVISSVMSIRNNHPYARLVERIIVVIPIAIALFAGVQSVRFALAEPQGPMIGPVLIASTFACLAIGDIRMFANRPVQRIMWLKRHLLRMLLAFAFATMPVLRIAINIALPFELTVVLPLAAALLAAWYFSRRLDRAEARKSMLDANVARSLESA